MTREFEAPRRLLHAIELAEPRLRLIPGAEAAKRSAPGKWSAKEIIGHLVDSASNNHQRFVRAAFQEDLVFPGYAQDGWVELQRYQEASWSGLITLWAAFNRHLAHVMSVVPVSVRTRVHERHNLKDIAFHPPTSPDKATLEHFMADYVDHLEHHLRQTFDPR